MAEKEKQEQSTSAVAAATDDDVHDVANDASVANSSSSNESVHDAVETGKVVDYSEHQDDIDENEQQQQDAHQGSCSKWMNHHRLGWLARLPGNWPRTFALIFGVIIPLFLLILVSMFFGYGLCQLEAPNEFESNNAILANRALVHTANNFQGNVSQQLPQICLSLYALNSSGILNATLLQDELNEIFVEIVNRAVERPTNEDNDTSVDDIVLPENLTASELLAFMDRCGKFGITLTKRFAALGGVEHEYIGDDLTFNWIRCDATGKNSSNSLLDQVWGRPYLNRTQLKPDVQAAGAVARWRLDAAQLFNATYDYLTNNLTVNEAIASIEAYEYAVQNANGFDHCYPNSASGAWFWFTVMTTIGYGNQAPGTKGGRAMIYTLGFLSILMFAIILGTAGTIIVTIWDDFINRTKLHQCNIPWVACLLWGFCYYAWMLAIGAVTQNWKEARLGEDMDFSEAYWFAYISTTTVGLGDYYLEPDVILRQDLITFPLMFSTGFVFLANFFVKLTEVLSSLVPSNRKSLEEVLIESKVPCMPEHVKKGIKVITDITHTTHLVHHVGGGRTHGASHVDIPNEGERQTSTHLESVPLDAVEGRKDSTTSKSQSFAT